MLGPSYDNVIRLIKKGSVPKIQNMPASSQSVSIRPLLVTTSPCVWIPESSKKVKKSA